MTSPVLFKSSARDLVRKSPSWVAPPSCVWYEKCLDHALSLADLASCGNSYSSLINLFAPKAAVFEQLSGPSQHYPRITMNLTGGQPSKVIAKLT